MNEHASSSWRRAAARRMQQGSPCEMLLCLCWLWTFASEAGKLKCTLSELNLSESALKRLLRLFFVALFLSCPALAHADTLQTFSFNSVLTYGTAQGTVIFDETTGSFAGGSITGSYNGTNYLFNYFLGSTSWNSVTYGLFSGVSTVVFQLVIPGGSNVNYQGGAVCAYTTPSGCQIAGGGGNFLTGFGVAGTSNLAVSGQLGTTPEPASIALLATGVVAMLGVARQRLRA